MSLDYIGTLLISSLDEVTGEFFFFLGGVNLHHFESQATWSRELFLNFFQKNLSHNFEKESYEIVKIFEGFEQIL
jgi:hypothetical protein